MSKKYKTVVSDTVLVPVKGSLSDENGKAKKFEFSLICKRLGADEVREMIGSERLITSIMSEVTTGWKDQRLVLEDDGTPAEFCEEALSALLDIPNIALLCYVAYQKESGAKEKN